MKEQQTAPLKMESPDADGLARNQFGKLLFNRKEAAALLSMSTVTLDRLVEQGLIRPNRATRRPLFTVSELTRFAEGQTNARRN